MTYVMDHIVLNVEDDEAMMAFYTGVLMMAPERLRDYRAGRVPFPSVRLNPDTVIDIFPKRMWEKSAPRGRGFGRLNHFCISLEKDGWDALVRRLNENNIPVEDGPVPRWGARGTGTSVYFRDPENNLIEARYYPDGDGSEDCLLGS